MDSDSVLKHIREFFDSEEGKEYIKRQQKEITHRLFIQKKYIDKFVALPMDARKAIVEKYRKKYSSDKWQLAEYKRGVEPCPDMFYEYAIYAEQYGKDVTEEKIVSGEYPSDFVSSIMRTPEDYYIVICVGQGTTCDVKTEEEFKAHGEYLKKAFAEIDNDDERYISAV